MKSLIIGFLALASVPASAQTIDLTVGDSWSVSDSNYANGPIQKIVICAPTSKLFNSTQWSIIYTIGVGDHFNLTANRDGYYEFTCSDNLSQKSGTDEMGDLPVKTQNDSIPAKVDDTKPLQTQFKDTFTFTSLTGTELARLQSLYEQSIKDKTSMLIVNGSGGFQYQMLKDYDDMKKVYPDDLYYRQVKIIWFTVPQEYPDIVSQLHLIQDVNPSASPGAGNWIDADHSVACVNPGGEVEYIFGMSDYLKSDIAACGMLSL